LSTVPTALCRDHGHYLLREREIERDRERKRERERVFILSDNKNNLRDSYGASERSVLAAVGKRTLTKGRGRERERENKGHSLLRRK
jgi:hypothetical protein